MEKMTYAEFRQKMIAFNEKNEYASKGTPTKLKGVIVFTEDSFTQKYPLEGRSYVVSSDNKAWLPNIGGYSIFGSALDGTDSGVRLEQYIDVECGDKNGWKVDYCYLTEE